MSFHAQTRRTVGISFENAIQVIVIFKFHNVASPVIKSMKFQHSSLAE